MTAAAQRQLARERRLLSQMHLRLQRPLGATGTLDRFEFTQSDLDQFCKTLPPNVVPWPAFTDDQNPQ